MKTNIKGLLAIVFALFMFSSIATKAQCAKINNSTRCDYKVVVTLFEVDPNTGVCNQVCGTPQSGIVPPGGTYQIFCGNCNPCNIQVQVFAINGVPITPIVTVDYFTGAQHLPVPNPCGATGIMYDPSIPGFLIF